jgi:hypothetical protein
MNSRDNTEFLAELAFSNRKQALAIGQVPDLPGKFEEVGKSFFPTILSRFAPQPAPFWQESLRIPHP